MLLLIKKTIILSYNKIIDISIIYYVAEDFFLFVIIISVIIIIIFDDHKNHFDDHHKQRTYNTISKKMTTTNKKNPSVTSSDSDSNNAINSTTITSLLVKGDTATTTIDTTKKQQTLSNASSDITIDTTVDVSDDYIYDNHTIHRWWYEDPPSAINGGVLNENGLNHISLHQYVAGSYTPFDTLLNPMWTYLTELFPISMAPNLITLCGGFFCVLGYVITWIYGTTTFHEYDVVPKWILLLNGICMILYYTFDCIDGKQARRTNSSSPLGQLFDHGVDCLCLQQHLSMAMCFIVPCTNISCYWYMYLQASLQISFFVAQWEEYYTGLLPHSTGVIGVTEVNYGLALWSISNIFFDYTKFYSTIVFDYNNKYQVKHIISILWISFIIILITLSIIRVIRYISRHRQKQITLVVQLSSLSKLLSPILICIVGPIYILPHHTIVNTHNIRYISLSIGFAMTIITNKMIVYSMAKLPYATIQIYEILYIITPCLWIKYDTNITLDGINLLWKCITLLLFIRLFYWITLVCQQICHKLNIHLFRIKLPKKQLTTIKEKKEEKMS